MGDEYSPHKKYVEYFCMDQHFFLGSEYFYCAQSKIKLLLTA